LAAEFTHCKHEYVALRFVTQASYEKAA
jgi:hypothetical protein